MSSSPTYHSSPKSEKNYSWQQKSGYFHKGGRYKKNEKPLMIRWKSGKKVDPRLLVVLEHFRELYKDREEFFKKVFPDHHDEFVDVFKKVGAVISRKKGRAKVRTMQRSLSLGSIEESTREIDESELVNQKFKVRPPAVVVGTASGQGGSSTSSKGGTTNKGSK